jgi:hypothetical protein
MRSPIPGHKATIVPVLMVLLGVVVLALVQMPVRADCPCNQEATFDYDDYAQVLRKYVGEDGMVDYEKLKANRAPLDRFVKSLGGLKKRTYRGWDEDAKLAFLVNAYNAITLKIVIDNYPIQAGWLGSVRFPKNSIRQIDGAFDGIKHRVMGRKMTLDQIEHQTLRRDFNEPRIHLALVCAAMSCPRLLDEPYAGEVLDQQFALQARHFVDQEDNFRIDRGRDRVYLSEIFKWFGEDFVKAYGTNTEFTDVSAKDRAVLNYLQRHLSQKDRTYLLHADYSVKYLDYDWTLNEQ